MKFLMMQREELNKELNNLKEVLESSENSIDYQTNFLKFIDRINEEFKDDINNMVLLINDICYFIGTLDFGRLARDCDEYPSMRYLDNIEKFTKWLYKMIELGAYE